MVHLNGTSPDSPGMGSLRGRRAMTNPSDGPSRVSPSNTLIITSLPAPFFHHDIQRHLRAHFSTYGNVSTWAPLAGLGRIVVVYGGDEEIDEDAANEGEVEQQSIRAADRAKRDMDKFELDLAPDGVTNGSMNGATNGVDTPPRSRTTTPKTTLRVYFGPMTPLALTSPTASSRRHSLRSGAPSSSSAHTQHHLAPPTLDKNFLISPPGSPPVGWQQICEDGPNKQTLADDLMRALRYLSVGDGADEEADDSMDMDDVVVRRPLPSDDEDEEIMSDEAEPDEVKTKAEPDLVIVQTAPDSDVPSLRVQRSLTPSPLPAPQRDGPRVAGSIGEVKATVESMQGGFGAEGPLGALAAAENRITPTSRPPPMGAY